MEKEKVIQEIRSRNNEIQNLTYRDYMKLKIKSNEILCLLEKLEKDSTDEDYKTKISVARRDLINTINEEIEQAIFVCRKISIKEYDHGNNIKYQECINRAVTQIGSDIYLILND